MKRILITLIALASVTITSYAGNGNGGNNGNNGSGIPVGRFVITTIEGTLQSASGYNYDVTAFADFHNGGSFDPNGNISLRRSWQDANGNWTPVVIYDKNGHVATNYTGGWPANSPFWKTQGKDMGNYMAGYQGDCTTSNPEVGGYGREIIELVYTAFATNYLPVVIATQYIQLYPYLPTQNNPPTVSFSSNWDSSGVTLNNIPNVSGIPPQITATISNIYPGATISMNICSVSNPTNTAAIPVPVVNGNTTGLWIQQVTFDLGAALAACGINQSATAPQTYTVNVTETLPAKYTDVSCANNANIIASSTFSVNLNLGIATQLGK